MPNYQIKTIGCLWEGKLCGTTLTLDSNTLGRKTTNKDKTCTHAIQVSKPSIHNDSIINK